MKFNELLKHHRIKAGLTLRACSGALNFDPSNWSKLERGVSPAPKDQTLLESWALLLSIEDTQGFLDAAAISRKEIPLDLASDEKVIAALPIFFKAMRGKKFKAFFEDLRKSMSPNRPRTPPKPKETK